MKATRVALPVLLLSAIAGLGTVSASAEPMQGHAIVTPADVKWSPAPASLPAGAQVAVLYGDPSKEGLFAMRLKFPKGYAVAPHKHPKPEAVTIISGTFSVGMGDTADETKVQALPAGSFIAIQPGMTHFVRITEETEVQINSNGPWGIEYVNPADDPRTKTN